MKCNICGVVWHNTVTHDIVTKKNGSIEEFRNDLQLDNSRLFVTDEQELVIMTRSEIQTYPYDNIEREHTRISLSELKDLTLDEYRFRNLSPYHQEHINNPDYQWVNCCNMYVKKSKMINGECPYHQRVMTGEEGQYLLYDEFNQDGEAW